MKQGLAHSWSCRSGFTQCSLLLLKVLRPCLSLSSLLEQLLLVLLLPESVQELVRLRQNLRYQCVLVEVFDVKYLPRHLIVLLGNLVDVSTSDVFDDWIGESKFDQLLELDEL